MNPIWRINEWMNEKWNKSFENFLFYSSTRFRMLDAVAYK